MKQYPVELHCHTNHSDGEFETEELIQRAVDFGYKGLILTDHNTFSGVEEIIEKELDKKLVFLKGIEWTTYFGHMLVHGPESFVDWREATIETIDQHIKKVKETKGLVGIAHPYAIGSPICTGCHFEFEIKEWSQVNYIEIWNRTAPHKQFWSEMAYELWTNLLKSGYHIAASAGRDWHREEGKGMAPAVTYIQSGEELTPTGMKEALRKGAMYITLGPRVEFILTNSTQSFSFGETISVGEYTFSINVLKPNITLLSELGVTLEKILIIQNEETVVECAVSDYNKPFETTLHCRPGYIRIEGIGEIKQEKNVRVLISSPIYVE